jgi:hypothetical protein
VLSQFAELELLDGFDGERPLLRAPASAPTIRQLMNHTAGPGYFFLNEDLLRYCAQTGLPSPLEGRKAALSAPLVSDPGTVWEYGVNTDWLGLVVEVGAKVELVIPLGCAAPARGTGPGSSTRTIGSIAQPAWAGFS